MKQMAGINSKNLISINVFSPISQYDYKTIDHFGLIGDIFMEQKMSRWGIGPIFASLSIGYGLIVFGVSRYFHPYFQMEFLPYLFRVILGTALIVTGLLFFFVSVVTVMRAYHAGNLVTGGIFKCCRHPLYASWAVWIVPGIVLWVNSWMGLTAPLFMYIILRILVKKEEIYLENVFDTEYAEYKKRVPCILPYGRLKASR